MQWLCGKITPHFLTEQPIILIGSGIAVKALGIDPVIACIRKTQKVGHTS